MLSAWMLPAVQRCNSEIQRDGRVALWIYAPGYIEDEPALESMTALTGFKFGMGEHIWGPMNAHPEL